jgi:hypothetical protein
VFRSGDDLFRLAAHFDMNDIGLAAFLMNHSNPSMVPPMRHTLVNRRLDYDRNFLSGAVGSEDSAQTDFSPLTRSLPEEAPRPCTVTL